MGVSTFQDLKKAISTNLIKSSKVTCKDFDLAQLIFSEDTITKKGKIIRKNLRKNLHDHIFIPPKLIELNKNVQLSIDTITINGMVFFTTISHDIYYMSTQFVPNKQPKHYRNCLGQLIKLYESVNFKISGIHCNNKFKIAFDKI